MELKSASMSCSRACAPCGDGASFSCAHGRTDRALLAFLDTMPEIPVMDLLEGDRETLIRHLV